MISLLAACGGSKTKAGNPAAPTASATTSAPTTCDGYTKGKGGVINVFCGGPAKATGMIGGSSFVFKGGSCVQNPTFLSINVGVLVGPDFTGAPPDYFGMVVTPSAGSFNDASATIDAIGNPHALTLSGTLDGDMKGGRFSGTDGSIQVTGSFSC
jgi:hypothetical protein